VLVGIPEDTQRVGANHLMRTSALERFICSKMWKDDSMQQPPGNRHVASWDRWLDAVWL
jgi:hypothetical protein